MRALLLCAATAAALAGCGGSSEDSELRRQLEEEKAEAHRLKCARAAKHGWTAEMKEWGCPQKADTPKNN